MRSLSYKIKNRFKAIAFFLLLIFLTACIKPLQTSQAPPPLFPIEFKNEFGLTYSEMTRKLSNPCRASTLQIRAKYPKKECSFKLYEKIMGGIQSLDKQRTKKQEFEQIKEEFIDEITELTNKYFKKVESFVST